MRFHVVGLPHTQTTRAYETCAFTSNVRCFSTMMHGLGHEIILYAGEENEADCNELVTCITKARQKAQGFAAPEDAINLDYNNHPVWKGFNERVIEEMQKRVQPQDIICLITGDPQARPIIEAFPFNLTCEFAVGYKGAMRKTETHSRVFCSSSWRHYVYGAQDSEGFFFDEVIPHYFEMEDFPEGNGDGEYYLFAGRLGVWKGEQIAREVCEDLGKKLIVIGQGGWDGYGEYLGRQGSAERTALMGGAIAVFAPTVYVEPFGKVAVEAQLVGTPVIATPWGAFPEIIDPGMSGFLCNSYQEFAQAVEAAPTLNRAAIREQAIARFSTEAVGPQYEAYFRRISTLFDQGWYQGRPSVTKGDGT